MLDPLGVTCLLIILPLAAQFPTKYFRAIPIFYNTSEILVFCLPG